MKKNGIYIALVTGLVCLAAYIYLTDSKTTLSAPSAEFNIKDTAAIGKVFLATKSGDRNTLVKRKDGWYINDVKASDIKINRTFITTLHQMRVRQPVPESAYKNVVSELASTAIKLEIYDTSGQEMKTFYIGNPTEEMYGTYGIMEGSDVPYVLHIPGFNGFLTPRLGVNAITWREEVLTRCTPASLESVEVIYDDSVRADFKIMATDTGFHLTTEANIQPDSVRVYNYLRVYGQFAVGQFIDTDRQKILDSLKKETPYATLKVRDEKKLNNLTMTFYPVPGELITHMYGVIEDQNAPVLMRYEDAKRSLVNPKMFESPKKEDWFYM